MSAAEHLLRGTYRPERHGPPENVVTMPQGQVQVEGWAPSHADLSSLGQKGKRFVTQWIDMHVCSLREGTILMSAAQALDESERWHKRSRAKGPHQARFARLALA